MIFDQRFERPQKNRYGRILLAQHAFVKKTPQIAKVNIDLGSTRYKALMNHRWEKKYDKKD